jgi:hypothetical protein
MNGDERTVLVRNPACGLKLVRGELAKNFLDREMGLRNALILKEQPWNIQPGTLPAGTKARRNSSSAISVL